MRKKVTVDVWKYMAPPSLEPVSQWCEKHRYLSAEDSALPGKISFDYGFTFHKGILDSIENHKEIVICSSSQIGKTSLILSWIAYYAANENSCPMMIVMPSLDQAASFSKDRLSPMLRDTPLLKGLVRPYGSRKESNSMFHKKFVHGSGHITMTTASSPTQLCARPIALLFLDECSRFPVSAGNEGDAIELAKARQKSFHNARTVMTSTPTIKDSCRISLAFAQSDQRYFMVPCQSCGYKQRLLFEQIQWPDGSPKLAKYECVECKHLHQPGEKFKMVKSGEWVKSKPESQIAGFHISELYSPFRTWPEIAQAYLDAKMQGSQQLQVFTNTVLGEVWNDEQDLEVEMAQLLKYRQKYRRNHPPEGVLFITAAVDVQKDGVFYEIVGWGATKESWSIDHGFIPGEIGNEDFYSHFDNLLERKFILSSGFEAPVSLLAIDSGYQTQWIYNYCRTRRRAIPVKGNRHLQMIIGPGRKVDILWRKKIYSGTRVYPIGAHVAKMAVFSDLKKIPIIGDDGAIIYPLGYCHFPETYTEDFFSQLLAERLVQTQSRNRAIKLEYVQIRDDNHYLDCRVYNRGCASLLGLDKMNADAWGKLKKSVGY